MGVIYFPLRRNWQRRGEIREFQQMVIFDFKAVVVCLVLVNVSVSGHSVLSDYLDVLAGLVGSHDDRMLAAI